MYDLDEKEMDPDFLNAFLDGAFSLASIAYPELAGFSAMSKAMLRIGTGALEVVDNLKKHDKIIDEMNMLEITTPDTATPLLQPGYIVCFSKEVNENANFSLNNSLRVFKRWEAF